jgi:hypothetical protein
LRRLLENSHKYVSDDAQEKNGVLTTLMEASSRRRSGRDGRLMILMMMEMSIGSIEGMEESVGHRIEFCCHHAPQFGRGGNQRPSQIAVHQIQPSHSIQTSCGGL